MNRRPLVRLLLALAAVVLAGACRQDMHNQPKVKPLSQSDFFADGQSSRTPPADTVARGFLRADKAFYTGSEGGEFVSAFPLKIDRQVLQRGEERFDIFCSPCHDRLGTGHGMIVRRGYKQPPSFHDDRLRQAKPGYFFDVITNGFNIMPSYASQIPPADRWAIVAYIRALQLSQNAQLTDLSAKDRDALKAATAAPSPAGAKPESGHE